MPPGHNITDAKWPHDTVVRIRQLRQGVLGNHYRRTVGNVESVDYRFIADRVVGRCHEHGSGRTPLHSSVFGPLDDKQDPE